MAFQSDKQFAGFLRTTAAQAVLAESAPAANFLLEERLPALREQAFLASSPSPGAAGWDINSWWVTFGNHFNGKVALPRRRASQVATFADENQPNHLSIESHQDVVRLESISALHKLYPVGFDTPAGLAAALHSLIQSRQPGQEGECGADQHSQLAEWLEGLNNKRDARPAYVAPFGEVEALLDAPDWAAQLRNMLGLAHFGGSPSKPLPVILCRYSLARVERAARKAKLAAWAAIPTVLEAGGQYGPSSAFFPFPKAASDINPFGFGVTVSFSDSGLDFKPELLHARLDYGLDDFIRVGELTDGITDIQLAAARERHFDLLETELCYRSDVP